MLNEKKIKYMTKAAAYETGAEKKNIEICSFCKTDYMGLQLLKSAASYTLSFVILVGLWAEWNLEEVMAGLGRAEYAGHLVRVLLALYIVGILLYEIITYAYFSWKYEEAKKSVVKYNKHLKNIHEFYEEQESEESAAPVKEKTGEEKVL